MFWSSNPKITASCLVVCPANKVWSTWLRGKRRLPPFLSHLKITKAAPTVLGFSYHLTQCPLNNGMVWQREVSIVVPGFGPTLHSDYLWPQIPVAWLCWNQSLDTERAVGDKFRRGQGGLCSFPARNNEAVISVTPGGGLAGETVKRGLSCTR